MKRIMSLFLALVLVCSCMATSVFATPESFADVPSDAYYHDAVLWAVQFGITAGVGENKFGPNNPCTRGQIMTMLWRAAGSPGHKAAESAFVDVNKGDYYYDAVLWAVENGVTAGVGENKFGPSNPCTRAQIVTFLWKARGSHEPTNTANQFADVASNAYYAKAVAWAVENKVTSGVGNNQFGPNQTCTRAQIVTFLWKADQITIPTPNPEPTECTEHELELTNTRVTEERQLTKTVVDTYSCKHCNYKKDVQHDAVQNLSSSQLSVIENEVVSYVNQFRAENGLSTLSTNDPDWDAWADLRASELPIAFGHARPNGESYLHAIGNKSTYGENVSAGADDAYGFFEAFKNSATHRSAMLIEDLTDISVGIYLDENGTSYCAMILIGET